MLDAQPEAAPHALQPRFHLGNGTGLAGWPSEDRQCGEQGCWPRLFILGTQKGATTSLFGALHKEGVACGTVKTAGTLQAPGAGAKEAHVFDVPESMWKMLMQQPGLYKRMYTQENCPTRTFLDATPRYSRHPAAPARMVELMPSGWLPELRFVFAIREPVARDLSWFNHKMNQARMHLGPGAHSPQVRHTPLLSSGHGDFCSLGDGNVWKGYPTYEGEVRCRKQELDHCLSEARSRLSNDKKAAQNRKEAAQNASGGHGYIELRDAERLEDYNECVSAIWRNWRHEPDEAQPSAQTYEGGEPPLLAWGMYLPQIRAWTRQPLLRSQLLVIDFDRLVLQPDDVLPRVTSFMGLPTLRKNELPHENEQQYARKVDVISCDTARTLYSVYSEWNERLVRGLREDRELGIAPPQEPPFEGFTTSVPCKKEEHIWLEEDQEEQAEQEDQAMQDARQKPDSLSAGHA